MKSSIRCDFKCFFKTNCVIGVILMVSYWFYKFIVEDRDVGVVDYELLDNTEIDFPVVSLCFENPFLIKKLKNELKKINQSLSTSSYLEYLKGDIHVDGFEKIDYNNITMDLDDYYIKSVFKLSNGSLSHTMSKPAHKVIFNGFYNGQFSKCFETQLNRKENPNIQDIAYQYDNTKLLQDLFYPMWKPYYIAVNIHHTGQFLVKLGNSQPQHLQYGKLQGGIIAITGIEFLKRRKTRKHNCLQNPKMFDNLVLRKHIISNGCSAPYHEKYKGFPMCSNMTKIKQYKYQYDKARKMYYPKPCERFSKVDRSAHAKDGAIEEFYRLVILYPEDMKIITQSKEVDGHALIGNIGGYVGLFLGNIFT